MSDRHIHDRRDCEVCEKLHAEIDALEVRVEAAEAKAAVIGGEWCAENREAGRNPCGACAWCCQTAVSRAEAAERQRDSVREEFDAYRNERSGLTATLEKVASLTAERDALRDALRVAAEPPGNRTLAEVRRIARSALNSKKE